MDGENHWQNTFPCISPFINFKNTLYHIFIMVLNQYFVLILFLNLRFQQIRKCHITTVGISETFSKNKQGPKIENLFLVSQMVLVFVFCFFFFFKSRQTALASVNFTFQYDTVAEMQTAISCLIALKCNFMSVPMTTILDLPAFFSMALQMNKGLWSSEDLIQYTSMFVSVRMSCLISLLLYVYKFSLIPLELQ